MKVIAALVAGVGAFAGLGYLAQGLVARSLEEDAPTAPVAFGEVQRMGDLSVTVLHVRPVKTGDLRQIEIPIRIEHTGGSGLVSLPRLTLICDGAEFAASPPYPASQVEPGTVRNGSYYVLRSEPCSGPRVVAEPVFGAGGPSRQWQ
jgi:hypothetical protein